MNTTVPKITIYKRSPVMFHAGVLSLAKRLTEVTLAAEWQLESEIRVQRGKRSQDRQWVVSACPSSTSEKEVEEYASDERERGAVLT